MAKRNIIPFGPQHPVLPEPIHLDLVTEDELVVEAIPQIGFVHRGLEKLVEIKDFQEFVYVAERVCGICSFMHGMSYCQAVEEVMQIEVPERALWLRTIWSELARIQSHLLWLGLAADGMGFESLFMHTWRIREHILDIIEMTTGGRIIFGSCKVGGVRRDINAETLVYVVNRVKELESEMREVTGTFINDYSVQHRFCGVGVISAKDAYNLGTLGPVAKGSGLPYDARRIGYAMYSKIDFEPVIEKDGDCYARCAVRVREIFQSIDIIRQCAGLITDGEIDVKVKGFPSGEFYTRVEQPRGEVIYYVRGNGTKFLERFRVRTPTFANVPAMVKVLQGCQIADVPNIILTIDPCISCTER
jgi:ech hydrogenase subunit E